MHHVLAVLNAKHLVWIIEFNNLVTFHFFCEIRPVGVELEQESVPKTILTVSLQLCSELIMYISW